MKRWVLGAFWMLGSLNAVGAALDPALETQAREAAGRVHDWAGSAANFEANVVGPLTSEAPLRTPSGKEFGAQIACPASPAFLEVFAQPGLSGDLAVLSLSQDLDMDGTADALYTAPFAVSGMCANGLVACRPGTWSGCTTHAWRAAPSGAIGLEPVPLSDLGGCYCFNRSCGAGLAAANLERIVSDAAGGAAAAMAAVDPAFVVSRTSGQGPQLRLHGQRIGGCEPGDTPTRYMATPSGLLGDAFVAADRPDSLYRLVAGSPAASGGDSERRTCRKVRHVDLDEVSLADIVRYDGGTGSLHPCADGSPGCLELVLGQIGNNYWNPGDGVCEIHEQAVSFWVALPDRILSATLEHAKWDDWMQVRIGDDALWTGPYPWDGESTPADCELSTSWEQNPAADFTEALRQGGALDFSTHVAVSGSGEGYAIARVLAQETCQALPDFVEDDCHPLELNPHCVLAEETVDGVQTLADGQPTGLAALASCQTLAGEGEACAIDVCRDWWRIERTYACEGEGFDLSDARTRLAGIDGSVSRTGYSDARLIDGGWVEESRALPELPEPTPRESCEAMCKTRRARVDTEVGGAGPVSARQTDPNTFDYFWRPCHAGLCQSAPGESMVQDCGCPQEFSAAAAMMQSLRMAGQDLTCTR